MSTGNELVTLKQVDNYYKDLRKRSAPVIFNTAIGNPAVFSDGADGLPIQSLKVHLLPRQEGTGDPSPENIRNFIPWNGIDIFGGGKNLVGCTIGETRSVNGIDYTVLSDGGVNCEGTANGSSYGIESKKLTLPSGMYTFSVTGATNAHIVIVKNNAYYREINGVGSTTFALTEETAIHFYIMFSNGAVANETVYVQLEVGQTATAYKPYKPITETEIDFSSPVYGGYYNLITGELWGTYAEYTFTGNEGFDRTHNTQGTSEYEGYFFRWAYDWQGFLIDNWNIGQQDVKVDAYPVYNNLSYWYSGISKGDKIAWTVDSYQGIAFRDDSYESADAFKQAITGKKMVYKLATPVLIATLDPIELRTLLGNNTILSDANGDIEVEYRADTEKFVEEAIADIPIASASVLGLVQPRGNAGIYVTTQGNLCTDKASLNGVKAGTSAYNPVVPELQHASAFYGLSKAAGVDMAQSSNPVGQFTDEAKIAIKEMLGIYDAPFRLIYELTVDEDTKIAEIHNDLYGLPFSLHEIIVKVFSKQTDGYSNGGIVINGNEVLNSAPFITVYNSFRTDGDFISYAHGKVTGNRFFGESGAASMTSSWTPSNVLRNPNAAGIIELNNITSIAYKSLNGYTVKAGSIITLYGR